MHRKELDKLKIALGGVYESSLFEGVNRFEKEREELLKASVDTFETLTVQSHIQDMEKALGSVSMQNTFNTKDDYWDYASPILDEIKNHDYDELQKSLKVDTEKYMKNDITQAFKSLNIVDDSLKKLNEASAIDLEKYSSSLGKAFEDLSHNENLLESSQNLLSISEEINKDKFKYDMNKLHSRKLPQYVPPSHKLPNMPNYGKEIIESLEIQKESLSIIVCRMTEQNEISQKQVNLNKLSSKQQIEALEKQIKQNKVSTEQQNNDTKKMIKITVFIAFISILIAMLTAVFSIKKADEIYDKENKSSKQQHSELLSQIDTIKNKDLDNKQIEILTAILKTMEKKNSKLKSKDVKK